MQMVDINTTDFVQKTIVLFKTYIQWIQVTLNIIRLIVLMKNALFNNIVHNK